MQAGERCRGQRASRPQEGGQFDAMRKSVGGRRPNGNGQKEKESWEAGLWMLTIPRGRGCSGTFRQIFTCFFNAELAAVVRVKLHEWFPGRDRPYID